MRILGLETSGPFCSVALQDGEKIYEQHENIPQQHAHVLLAWIADLLTESNLNVTDLTAIAYSCGPGGFTGIRIGAAMVQGLALTHQLPVLAIPSLQVIAQGVHRLYQASNVVVIQDARMQQVYYGHYVLSEVGLMKAIQNDQLVALSALESINITKSCFLVSNMSTEMDSLKEKAQEFIVDCSPSAVDILPLSIARIRTGDLTTADEALPIYLQSENLWRKLV